MHMDRIKDIDGHRGQPTNLSGSDMPVSAPKDAAHDPVNNPQRPEPVSYWSGVSTDQTRIGIVSNPRSHGNASRSGDITRAVAQFDNVELVTPRGRAEIAPVLADFASSGIDYLIVNGGDGTVRDVLTAGVPIFGDRWPRLAVLPRGKTNALTEDLEIPRDWSLMDALAVYDKSPVTTRRPLLIRAQNDGAHAVAGFIMGAGSFTTGVRVAQDAHRLGAFGGLAVGLTAIWGALQTIFGSNRNPWRRGLGIDIQLHPDNVPMAHSGHGERSRRSIMLATTLRTLPMGLTVYGPPREGLKLAVIDRPRRLIWAMMPALLRGWNPDWLGRWGYHRVATPGFDITLDDEFILDGEIFPAGSYRVEQGAPLTFQLAAQK